MGAYRATYERSITDPTRFWGLAARDIRWSTPPDRVLDDGAPPFHRWFTGGELNTCENALDRHVDEGNGDRVALIYDSPVTGTGRSYTYRELTREVAAFAGALRALGVDRGDRVIIYMPMVPRAVVAMLACARLGAVHSVVFGGFAPKELAVRVEDARPKVIVSASCGVEGARVLPYKPMLDAALELASHQVGHCVILQRPEAPEPGARADLIRPRDVEWDEAVARGRPAECVPVAATDPLYILYTSGTTGRPKGVVRDNGGHAVALRWSMENIYGVGPGDVFWTASDVGWVVGHSYIVYAPLLTGCTTVLYEGKPVGTPDAGAFWRVAAEHRVKAMFTAPTAIRAIKKEDPEAKLMAAHDLSALETLFLAGERLDPDTYRWASHVLDRPVIDHWWQTETGWPIVANPRGLEHLPLKPGSPTVPVPGYDVRVVTPDGREAAPGDDGDIVIRLPMPPGTLPTLWQDDERFVESYLSRYPGHYLTGDGGHIDEDGYVWVMGRTDDVINVAGHRLSTGTMEEVIAAHPAVAECAVIGVHDDLKGQVPRGFVVLKSGADIDAGRLSAELAAAVRRQVGPVASFKEVSVVPALPKTRSGKILRATMRGLADGHETPVPPTIEDPAVLDRLRPILRGPSAPA
ncbi:MAG: propionate--CoA ligase [Streptosporangiaceae bacterium]|jgi:propionyl-CoA synthetase|nr:propionate--CoA ligase [Streptosporangiaceae bacterium]